MRRVHRFLALASAAFLASTAVTGLLWAYAPFLYWEEGYMKKKASVPAPPLRTAALGVQDAIRVVERALGSPVDATAIVLRQDSDRLLYEVQYRSSSAPSFFLIDAMTGAALTPLSEAHAVQIARQYVWGTPDVESVTQETFVTRGSGAPTPAYRIRFDQPRHPEIVIHRDSGQILEDADTVRRFHFVVMQLHQLNFFGFKKTLVIVSGLPLLALVTTGVAMWAAPKVRRIRASAPCTTRAAVSDRRERELSGG